MSVPSSPASRAQWINLLFGAALIVPCVLAHHDLPGPPCLFKTIFHVPCPGCGLTRSFRAIWRGDLSQAIRYHPLGPLLFLLCVAFLLLALFQKPLAHTPLALYRAHQWLLSRNPMLTLAVLMLGVWLVRLSLLFAYRWGIHTSLTGLVPQDL